LFLVVVDAFDVELKNTSATAWLLIVLLSLLVVAIGVGRWKTKIRRNAQ
jgi:hypothetical protein